MQREGIESAAPEIQPHAVPAQSVLSALESHRRNGLSVDEARRRLATSGPNELAEAPPIPWWQKLLAQFNELVIWILIVAAIISGAMGEWADTVAIVAIVLLNGLLGFFQEEKAGRALAALRKLSAPMAKVIRGGLPQTIAARELVAGDRIDLEAGDHIPADVRVIEAFGFRVQEAALTGESVPVDKDGRIVLPLDTPLGDRRNMAYMGTVAAAGKATALVTATGMNTELGRIAGMLQCQEVEPTPLQRRLTELGKVLVVVCLALVSVIFVLQLLRGGKPQEVFLLSVSLAVAAVPEGLPAVVTVALALGLQRMVRRNALVRKLPSVETLGSVTVICSDKTGTLTRNEMTVRTVVAGGAHYSVTGTGYTPQGQFFKQHAPESISQAAVQAGASCEEGTPRPGLSVDPLNELDLLRALTVGAHCNNAKLVLHGDGEPRWEVIGDPTEGALVVAAMKAGMELVDAAEHVLHEIPFDSDRKAMSVVYRMGNDETMMYVKGAPEVILANCTHEQRSGQIIPLTEARRQEIGAANGELASQALRVLGLAFRENPPCRDGSYPETELVFVGLAGMIDPPRDEVRSAVRTCHTAGIRPVMITGDHPATARAIAHELHLGQLGDAVVTGQELDRMSEEELAGQLEKISVYARVSAEHKLRVVQAWKAQGQVVAMTGDGVNDAPAVKVADIGIAMGVTGTDVTKEASDMVLTDDNFASIVSAVEEGRGIFDNIQKFVHYLLSCNTGEVLFMFVAAAAGWPAPLVAIQLLWINLVTDGLPALALGMEPPERDVMQRRPRPPREPVITLQRGMFMLCHGTLIALASVIGFHVVRHGQADLLPRAQTVAFCIMACSQLFFAFTCRSSRHSLLRLGLLSNSYLIGAVLISGLLQLSVIVVPAFQPVLKTVTLGPMEWGFVLLLSLMPALLVEAVKELRRALYRTTRGGDEQSTD